MHWVLHLHPAAPPMTSVLYALSEYLQPLFLLSIFVLLVQVPSRWVVILAAVGGGGGGGYIFHAWPAFLFFLHPQPLPTPPDFPDSCGLICWWSSMKTGSPPSAPLSSILNVRMIVYLKLYSLGSELFWNRISFEYLKGCTCSLLCVWRLFFHVSTSINKLKGMFVIFFFFFPP